MNKKVHRDSKTGQFTVSAKKQAAFRYVSKRYGRAIERLSDR